MKARTILHLADGSSVKLREPLDQLEIIYSQAAKAHPGSAFKFNRITDHGSVKQTVIPAAIIVRMEEL